MLSALSFSKHKDSFKEQIRFAADCISCREKAETASDGDLGSV